MDIEASSQTCRWLITDVDDTITGEHGEISLRAVEEMRRLEDSGVSVGLVSGRPFPMIRMLGEYLGISGPLIAENGGVAFCNSEVLVFGNRSVAEQAAGNLTNHITLSPTWDNSWRMTDFAVKVVPDIDDVRRLARELAPDIDLHVSSIMIHFSLRGIDKASAVTRCLDVLGGHSNEVLVAGDASSDLSLFENFSHNIAPANAAQEISERATFLATRPLATGFVEGIEHFRSLGTLP